MFKVWCIECVFQQISLKIILEIHWKACSKKKKYQKRDVNVALEFFDVSMIVALELCMCVLKSDNGQWRIRRRWSTLKSSLEKRCVLSKFDRTLVVDTDAVRVRGWTIVQKINWTNSYFDLMRSHFSMFGAHKSHLIVVNEETIPHVWVERVFIEHTHTQTNIREWRILVVINDVGIIFGWFCFLLSDTWLGHRRQGCRWHFLSRRICVSTRFINSLHLSRLLCLFLIHFGISFGNRLQISLDIQKKIQSILRVFVFVLTWRKINVSKSGYNILLYGYNIFSIVHRLFISRHTNLLADHNASVNVYKIVYSHSNKPLGKPNQTN